MFILSSVRNLDMSKVKKNILISSVIIAFVSVLVFTSSMLANAIDGSQDVSEGAVEAQADEVAELSASKIQMFRLYNPYTGEHFYTSDSSEKANLVKIGWNDEGIGWVAPKTSGHPVYRLNNPYSADGDHHYTTNSAERDSLTKGGWQYEGVGWYSLAKDDEGALPLLRQYNPYAQSGTHNYTTSQDEENNLVKAGWRAEGVGWYGYDKATKVDGDDSGDDSKTAIDFSKAKVDTASKVYKAAQWQPSVSITGLTKNTDYTVTYGTNKNVGDGTITITGKGKYTGSKKYTFKITQKEITSVTWGTSTFTYDGNSHVPTATAVGVLSADAKNFKVTVSGSQSNAGTYTAKATAVSNSNYKLKSNFTKNFTINKKEVTVSGIKGVDKVWDGTTDAELFFDAVVIDGKLSRDQLGVSAIGKFVSADASEEPITINISNITLTGESAGNYKLASKGNQTTTTASIYIEPEIPPVVTYDTQGHGEQSFSWGATDGHVSEPSEQDYGTATGLKLEGWYTDSKCFNKWDFASMSTTKDITLYANWVPDSDANVYWIGPAKDMIAGTNASAMNEEYVSADCNVKKSSAEIVADIQSIKQEAAEGTGGEGSVTAEYKEFMQNDNFHLYTKWSGTTIDGSGQAQSENAYAEFRIIEVGEHDGDGSTLTFQSVYNFPEAQTMKSDGDTTGGWGSSDLRTYINGTNFAGMFTSAFTDKVVAVPKVSMNGGATDDPTQVTDPVSDKFWLASIVELTGTTEDGYVNEGKQYAYYSDKTYVTGQNPYLIRLTRAGYTCTGASGSESGWWTRSPHNMYQRFNRIIGSSTQTIKNVSAETKFGVVPCFCF